MAREGKGKGHDNMTLDLWKVDFGLCDDDAPLLRACQMQTGCSLSQFLRGLLLDFAGAQRHKKHPAPVD